MIEITQLNKTYHKNSFEVHALKDISLTIDDGEFLAIVGPSGSGKSTLLHLIAALDTPDSGHIIVNHKNIFNGNDQNRSLYRLKQVGMVFQQDHLIEHLTVQENIELPLLLEKTTRKKKRALIKNILAEVDLTDRANHTPEEISGGQMQRAALARALINNPHILLADEPTGDLDPQSAARILELLKTLQKEKGITIIMVTHDHKAAQIADRIIHLENGSLT